MIWMRLRAQSPREAASKLLSLALHYGAMPFHQPIRSRSRDRTGTFWWQISKSQSSFLGTVCWFWVYSVGDTSRCCICVCTYANTYIKRYHKTQEPVKVNEQNWKSQRDIARNHENPANQFSVPELFRVVPCIPWGSRAPHPAAAQLSQLLPWPWRLAGFFSRTSPGWRGGKGKPTIFLMVKTWWSCCAWFKPARTLEQKRQVVFS